MTSRHGLANIGNTCYLNSAFQSLRRAQPFADYFGTDAWTNHRHDDRKGHKLAEHTANLVQQLQAPGNSMVNPVNFVRSFLEAAKDFNDEIRLGAQADAAEALQILLDSLHMQQAREVIMDIAGAATNPEQNELLKSLESWSTFFRKEYSPIVDAFYGQTQTKVVCQTCNTCSTRYEPWGVLKVPIPGAEKPGAAAPTLADCIASAMATETLDDYACDVCKKKGPARMEHAISRFPKHIILSLKRFTNQGAKVRARIPYDENDVDFATWRSWPGIQGTQRYRVMSTIEHLGSSRGGHYIMRTREAIVDASGAATDEWVIYDDGNVVQCKEGGVAGPDTYMLFLEKI